MFLSCQFSIVAPVIAPVIDPEACPAIAPAEELTEAAGGDEQAGDGAKQGDAPAGDEQAGGAEEAAKVEGGEGLPTRIMGEGGTAGGADGGGAEAGAGGTASKAAGQEAIAYKQRSDHDQRLLAEMVRMPHATSSHATSSHAKKSVRMRNLMTWHAMTWHVMSCAQERLRRKEEQMNEWCARWTQKRWRAYQMRRALGSQGPGAGKPNDDGWDNGADDLHGTPPPMAPPALWEPPPYGLPPYGTPRPMPPPAYDTWQVRASVLPSLATHAVA